MEPANKDQIKESTLPEENARPTEVTVRKEPEKELFSWIAPARPFKRRNREFYVTIIAITVIVGLILLLTEGFMPVILLISLIFLFYILNTVEPEKIEYKITNKGIKVGLKKTQWEALNNFWITKRSDNYLLVFGTYVLPGRMELVINEVDRENLKKIISEFVTEEEIPPSGLDKAANWFAKKLP
ncbi:MAG: hypothetical protein ABIJ05_05110, partial [Patescibacteria group bacterium]